MESNTTKTSERMDEKASSDGGNSFTCDICKKTFKFKADLKRHIKAIHSGQSFSCEKCAKTFNRKDALKRHLKTHSQEKQFSCGTCKLKFYRKDKLDEHQKTCKYTHAENDVKRKNTAPNNKSSKQQKIEDDQDCSDEPCDRTTSAIQGKLKTFQYKPRSKEKYDLTITLKHKQKHLHRQLSKQLQLKRGIKWFVNVKAKLVKTNSKGEEIVSEAHFRSLCTTTVNGNEIEQQLAEANAKIESALTTYQKEGSGWLLSYVLHVDLNVAQYTPIKASSFLPLPKKLRDKKAILNIQNNDNQCFKWSVLAALHPIQREYQPHRIHHYVPFEHELDFNGIDFPVSIDKIPKFEKQNNIAINVFGFEDGTLFPVHITKQRFDIHVNLLLYCQGHQNHYCLIRNLNRLLSVQRKHNGTMFHCSYCLHGFVREDFLQDHQPRCSQHGMQKTEFPSEENNTLYFKDFHKQLKVPFIIYADFESLTTKIHSVSQDPSISSTTKYQHHQACGHL